MEAVLLDPARLPAVLSSSTAMVVRADPGRRPLLIPEADNKRPRALWAVIGSSIALAVELLHTFTGKH